MLESCVWIWRYSQVWVLVLFLCLFVCLIFKLLELFFGQAIKTYKETDVHFHLLWSSKRSRGVREKECRYRLIGYSCCLMNTWLNYLFPPYDWEGRNKEGFEALCHSTVLIKVQWLWCSGLKQLLSFSCKTKMMVNYVLK